MESRSKPQKSAAARKEDRALRDYPPHERDNAQKVHGTALRELGRRHGIPTSTMVGMPDDKLRKQIGHTQAAAAMRESGHAVG